MTSRRCAPRRFAAMSGFSLVEISIVLVVVATMLAGVLPAITEGTKVKDTDATADRLEGIEEAIQAYYNTNGSIPCPSNIVLGVNTADFGKQADNPGPLFNCTEGALDASFGPVSNVVGGGVPTKTLGLPDEFAFDGWGRRIYYHVDTRATVASTFDTAGGISVDDATTGAPFRTTTAVYALVSAGRNGHGAYTRNGAVRANTGSVNADEINNCDTGGTVCGGAYNATLVQKLEGATNPNDPTTNFDDVVSYKLKGALIMGAKEGQSDTSQGLFATWSQSIASGAEAQITGMTTVHNDLPSSTFAGGTLTVGTGEDGWYTLSATVSTPNAGDQAYVAVRVNGTSRAHDTAFTTVGGAPSGSATTAYRLASGDTVTIGVRQLTGATKVFTGTFSVARVSGSVNMATGGASTFWADAGSNHINNTNSGNVGIGTTAPTEKLTIGDYSARTAIGLYGLYSDPSSPGTDANGDKLFLYKNASWKTGIGFGALNDLWVQSTGGTNDPGFRVFTGINAGGAPVERLRVRNDGNVGIGTTTPTAKLQVVGTTTGLLSEVLYIQRPDETAIGTAFGNNANGAIRFGASGGSRWAIGSSTQGGDNRVVYTTHNNFDHSFEHAGTALMRIMDTGNVGIGTAAPLTKLHVEGEIFAGGAGKFVSNMPGTAGAASNVCYSGTGRFDACTSLRKFKEDIQPIDVGLETVHKLRPVAYKWKDSGRPDIGFIAEEASEVDPRFGEIGTNGKLTGVRYSQLTALLAKSIQELDDKVDALAANKGTTAVPSAAAPLPQWVIVGLIAPWLGIFYLGSQLRRRR